MATQPVLVCQQFTQAADGAITCTLQKWVDSYVVEPELQAQLQLLINGGFDKDTFLQFFGGTLLMFAVGFGVGLCISQIRRLKI